MFLKLTEVDYMGNIIGDIWINTALVLFMSETGLAHTWVCFLKGTENKIEEISVKESPEYIASKIEEYDMKRG